MGLLIDDLATTLKIAIKELEHDVPSDCNTTGSLTGDASQDLVECPACTAIASAKNVLFRYNSFSILKQQIKLIEGE
jgi:hypothetical protein